MVLKNKRFNHTKYRDVNNVKNSTNHRKERFQWQQAPKTDAWNYLN